MSVKLLVLTWCGLFPCVFSDTFFLPFFPLNIFSPKFVPHFCVVFCVIFGCPAQPAITAANRDGAHATVHANPDGTVIARGDQALKVALSPGEGKVPHLPGDSGGVRAMLVAWWDALREIAECVLEVTMANFMDALPMLPGFAPCGVLGDKPRREQLAVAAEEAVGVDEPTLVQHRQVRAVRWKQVRKRRWQPSKPQSMQTWRWPPLRRQLTGLRTHILVLVELMSRVGTEHAVPIHRRCSAMRRLPLTKQNCDASWRRFAYRKVWRLLRETFHPEATGHSRRAVVLCAVVHS